ncbi:MAG: hypothetical protein FWH21_01810 [Kiritimatiellaeota bacterium]|nr:hypothetical protein [Kiritimatiellota bacterium]
MKKLFPLLICSLALRAAEPPALWVYYSTNLLVDENVTKLEARMKEAAAAGYSAFTLTDSKFGKLGEMDKHYFDNIAKVKRIAAENNIEIIPMLYPIGWSESLLWNDPNLAEGIPVREAPFVVRGNVAMLETAPIPLDRWGWVDETMTPIENGFRCTDLNGRNGRFNKRIKVNPFRQYHVSVDIRTENFRGTPEIKPLTPDPMRTLNHADLKVKPTQDWITHHIIFNSFDNTEILLYFGVWDGTTGTLEWRNPKIEETAFVNLLRRDGAPLTVTSADGKPLVEGHDFEPLVDPLSGRVPWKGDFDLYHEPPELRTKNLPDGTRLNVSFYHPLICYGGSVMICISDPKTEDILRDHARRVHAAWGAKRYFMSHDEIRALNWDKSCMDRNLTSGEILADNIAKCAAWIREAAPDTEIYVWGDMFDPNHNAHKDYYFVRGDLAGSWKGLDKRIIAVPWAVEFADKSAAWFSGLGMRMVLAGYYDSPPARSLPWAEAAKKYPGVQAIMYTTWQENFTDLKAFAETIRSAK